MKKKCKCGKLTSNLSGVCKVCLDAPPKVIPPPEPAKEITGTFEGKSPDEPPSVFKCSRCTCPTENPNKVCDTCTRIANQPKKCPRCGGPMEIRTGYLGDFWGCVEFPRCGGTITARGTYMRKFSN